MTDNNKDSGGWFSLVPLAFIFLAAVFISSERRSSTDPTGFSYPESYRTGLPGQKEVTYGTKKTFKESKFGAWAEETWEWPQSIKDNNIYPHDSDCGHVLWYLDSEGEPGKPYAAVAYHNFSDHHNFSTLREADEFVERWCKP